MKKTEHYQLNLWDAEDAIQHEGFNADNEKIDAALAELAAGGTKIASGSYTGNGKYSNTYTSLTFPFPPKLLIVQDSMSSAYRMVYPVGAARAQTYSSGDSFYWVTVTVSGNTIQWKNTSAAEYQLNGSSSTYYWVALG